MRGKKDHRHHNFFYSETLYELAKMFFSGIYCTQSKVPIAAHNVSYYQYIGIELFVLSAMCLNMIKSQLNVSIFFLLSVQENNNCYQTYTCHWSSSIIIKRWKIGGGLNIPKSFCHQFECLYYCYVYLCRKSWGGGGKALFKSQFPSQCFFSILVFLKFY